MKATRGKALCFALALTALPGCAKPDSASAARSTTPSSTATDGGSADQPLGGGSSSGSPSGSGSGTGTDAGSASVAATPALCVLGGPPPATPGETLVFADDFNGTSIDTTKWNVWNDDRAHGTILSTFTTDMVQVHDGSVFLSVDRNTPGAAFPYKAGFLDAQGKFSRTYGKYELRARFPYLPGVWYALWARPTTQSFPEVDIEVTNQGATQVYFVDHWAGPPLPANTRRAYFVTPIDQTTFDFSAFHTYTVMWKPGLLTVAVDGDVKLTQTSVGVPDVPLAWKINAWAGGWPGVPSESATLPVTFEVDYFHVYRLDGLIADPSIFVSNKQTSYDSTETIDIAIADFDEACVHVELYDGSTRIAGLSAPPYSFPVSSLAKGRHALSLVATDGVRSTITALDAVIN